MSYLISNNKIIAKTSMTLKSGAQVRYSYTTTDEGQVLVNSGYAKISNAKKWAKEERLHGGLAESWLIDDTGIYLDFHIK